MFCLIIDKQIRRAFVDHTGHIKDVSLNFQICNFLFDSLYPISPEVNKRRPRVSAEQQQVPVEEGGSASRRTNHNRLSRLVSVKLRR